jgi:hypothetical protein
MLVQRRTAHIDKQRRDVVVVLKEALGQYRRAAAPRADKDHAVACTLFPVVENAADGHRRLTPRIPIQDGAGRS